MPAYPDPNAPHVRAFVARLARLTDDEWRRIASQYDDDSDTAILARGIVTEIVRGDHLSITEAQVRDRLASARDAERGLEEAVAHAARPESARRAAVDALWAVLVYEDLQGEREWARRTLLAPFAGQIPTDA